MNFNCNFSNPSFKAFRLPSADVIHEFAQGDISRVKQLTDLAAASRELDRMSKEKMESYLNEKGVLNQITHELPDLELGRSDGDCTVVMVEDAEYVYSKGDISENMYMAWLDSKENDTRKRCDDLKYALAQKAAYDQYRLAISEAVRDYAE